MLSSKYKGGNQENPMGKSIMSTETCSRNFRLNARPVKHKYQDFQVYCAPKLCIGYHN